MNFLLFLSLSSKELGLGGFGGTLFLSVLGPFDGEDQVVVAVAVHCIDSALSIVAVVEVDEGEATGLVRSTITALKIDHQMGKSCRVGLPR